MKLRQGSRVYDVVRKSASTFAVDGAPVEASFTQPTLIFQGLHDRSVDHTTVEAFARSRSNVTLSLLEDDHQLIASLPIVWDGIAHWLGLAA